MTETVVRMAVKKYGKKDIWVAWSGGKDSTILLYIIKNMYGAIPFPVIFTMSILEHPRSLTYVKDIQNRLGFRLVVKNVPNTQYQSALALKDVYSKKLALIGIKSSLIKNSIDRYGIRALMWGTRHDEVYINYVSRIAQNIQKKGYTFSHAQNYHPLLHFNKKNVWEYIHSHQIPIAQTWLGI